MGDFFNFENAENTIQLVGGCYDGQVVQGGWMLNRRFCVQDDSGLRAWYNYRGDGTALFERDEVRATVMECYRVKWLPQHWAEFGALMFTVGALFMLLILPR